MSHLGKTTKMVLWFCLINHKNSSLTLKHKKYNFPIIFYEKLNLGEYLVF